MKIFILNTLFCRYSEMMSSLKNLKEEIQQTEDKVNSMKKTMIEEFEQWTKNNNHEKI